MAKKDKLISSRRRNEFLEKWSKWFEIPLVILGFCWLIIFIIELTRGLNPLLENLSFLIWMIFIFDFSVRFLLAPVKKEFIKQDWIALISLAIPPIRMLRAFHFLRFSFKSLYLIRILSSIRHGMQIISIIIGRHGFNYIALLTFMVIIIGAAGMYAFENEKVTQFGFKSYGDALWWTAMIITTMGSDFWPKTVEGRILCLGLSIYAFAVFGYITANVASYLIEKDVGKSKDTKKIIKELETIQIELKKINSKV